MCPFPFAEVFQAVITGNDTIALQSCEDVCLDVRVTAVHSLPFVTEKDSY